MHERGGSTPPDRPEDAILLVRLAASDEAALDALLERYWAPVYRYALRRTGSADVAADVAQEVFCLLWERRAAWRPSGSVRALLFRLARNAAVSAHRRTRAGERAAQAFASAAPDHVPASHAAEHAELREALAAAIDVLPPRRREAFLLRMFDDLSYDEIAAVMGTTRQTVANQLTRALATLRASLAHLLD